MGFFKQLTLLALTIGLGLNLAGCQPSDSKAKKQPSLTSISVSPGSATVMLSSTQALRVIATFSNNSSLDVTSASSFSSSATSVALVSSAGVVTAIRAGGATITATYSALGITRTATSAITVSSATLVSIAVTPTAPTVAVSATQPLTVIGTYNEGSRAVITTGLTFATSDPSIATVDASGVVAGVAEGTATITTTETNSGRSTTTLVTVGGGGGGLVQLVNGVWSSNYSQLDPSTWQSTEGGDAGTYIDESVPTQYWWNGVAPNDATPSFYFGYGISVNAKPWGFGTFVKAPGNGTADMTGYASLKIAVWGNDQLMNTSPTLTVILKGPDVGGCTTELQGSINVAGIGVQNYTVPLDSFVLQTACGNATVAQALAAGVAQVHIQVLGDNVQYVAGGDADGNYPNGLNVGPISFSSEGGGGGDLVQLVNGVWSSNYTDQPVAWTSVEGGAAGRYIDTGVPTLDWWSGVAPNDATPSYYFGYGINVNAKPWGFGTFVSAPGNGTADMTGYTSLKIAVWGNDQLMNTSPTLTVILKGPDIGGCTAELQGSINVAGIGVQNYTVPLNTFVLQTACGYASAAEVLAAGLAQIHIQVLGSNVQYVAGGDADGNYPNGLNVGPISFSSEGGGGGGAVVFASNYSQLDPSNWQSTEGGDAGNYIDDSVPTQYWWNGVAPGDATPSFYFGYGISVNAKPWGFGAFVSAPANGTADVTGTTSLKIAVWGNDELMNTNPTLTLILKGPEVGGCTAELKGSVVVAAPGVQNYTVPLSTFTLQTACGYGSAAAALAAGVAQVHIQVLGDNVQYVTGGPVDYANGLNVGPISFE